MSREVSMQFRNVGGSQAGLGVAGEHTLIADRPAGMAGGKGLGFNGAELLSAALGGCFWNDLHYAAAAKSVALSAVEVSVNTTLSGAPLRVTAAEIRARIAAEDPEHAQACFDAACADSTIANSLMAAFPITFVLDR